MKIIIHISLVGLMLLLANTTYAQSLIAVQNGSNATYYASLDSAITYAAAGSYIYIPGGSFSLSKSINKELHIVGVGHNPDSCALTGISEVIGNILILNGSDHGSITGLKISGTFSFGASANDVSINYYDIERCNVRGAIELATRSLNIFVNECVIQDFIRGNNTQDFKLSKCIVEGREFENPGVAGSVIQYFDKNASFTNNIFIGWNTSLWYVVNCSFRNNIFRTYAINRGANSNNQFQNNLFNYDDPSSIAHSAGNLFINNITGPVASLFYNQTGYVFDYKQDYHILPTSIVHNAGTDGTDLGIYGTGNPWKEGSLPGNPHIQSSSISTVNGNLNVKIKVASQDN